MSIIESAFDVPDNIKSSIHAGLTLIADLDERGQERLLAWARVPRARGLYGDNKSLVSETGLPQEHAGAVRLAVAMMVGSLRGSSTAADEFISAGLDKSAFTEAESPGLTRFAELIIACRSELTNETDLAQLQDVVLPTLTEFDVTLDARVEISDGAVIRGVPVVIAYVDTDAENQVVWFQMNAERVRELRDELTNTLDQIDTLREWLEISIKPQN